MLTREADGKLMTTPAQDWRGRKQDLYFAAHALFILAMYLGQIRETLSAKHPPR